MDLQTFTRFGQIKFVVKFQVKLLTIMEKAGGDLAELIHSTAEADYQFN